MSVPRRAMVLAAGCAALVAAALSFPVRLADGDQPVGPAAGIVLRTGPSCRQIRTVEISEFQCQLHDGRIFEVAKIQPRFEARSVAEYRYDGIVREVVRVTNVGNAAGRARCVLKETHELGPPSEAHVRQTRYLALGEWDVLRVTVEPPRRPSFYEVPDSPHRAGQVETSCTELR